MGRIRRPPCFLLHLGPSLCLFLLFIIALQTTTTTTTAFISRPPLQRPQTQTLKPITSPPDSSQRQRQTPRRQRGHATAILEAPQRYSSQDWVLNLKSLTGSRIAKRISGHLVFNTVWAAAIVTMYEFMPQWHIGAHISPLPHQLMSSALGLLLVFRTNAAYDRFWEARKVWGSVTNVCRNLARTGRIALDRRFHIRFSMLIIAFAVCLRAHLQRTVVGTELEALLPNWECDQIRMDPCPPALLAMKITQLLDTAVSDNTAKSAEFYNLYMEQLVGELVNCLGMAERILLTPVPASYSRHTSRFLSLYTLTLPFVLVHELELITVPAVAAICWTLFSIEEIGHLIEEPFSIGGKQLPLERMTATITRDVKSLLRISPGVNFAAFVDDELLSTEDRMAAENAPRLPRKLVAALAAAEPMDLHDHVMGERGGGRNDTTILTAASASTVLGETETMNI